MQREEDVSGTASLACGRREEGANENFTRPCVMVARTFLIVTNIKLTTVQVTRHIEKTFSALVIPIV